MSTLSMINYLDKTPQNSVINDILVIEEDQSETFPSTESTLIQEGDSNQISKIDELNESIDSMTILK